MSKVYATDTQVGPLERCGGASDHAIVVCTLWLRSRLLILLSIYFGDTMHALMVY